MLVSISPVVYESYPPQFQVKKDSGEVCLMKADDVWNCLVQQDFRGGDWSLQTLRRIMRKSADMSKFIAYILSQPLPSDSVSVSPIGESEQSAASVYISKSPSAYHHVPGQLNVFEVSAGDTLPALPPRGMRQVRSVRCSQNVPHAAVVVDGVPVAQLHFGFGLDKCSVQFTMLTCNNTVRIDSATRDARFVVETVDEITPATATTARTQPFFTYPTAQNVVTLDVPQTVVAVWVRCCDGEPEPNATFIIDDKLVGMLGSFTLEPTGWLKRNLHLGLSSSFCRKLSVVGLKAYTIRCQCYNFARMPEHTFA